MYFPTNGCAHTMLSSSQKKETLNVSKTQKHMLPRTVHYNYRSVLYVIITYQYSMYMNSTLYFVTIVPLAVPASTHAVLVDFHGHWCVTMFDN